MDYLPALKRRRDARLGSSCEDKIESDITNELVMDEDMAQGQDQLSGQTLVMSERPEHRVFQNQLVLDNVATYLDFAHLKILRLVNGPCNAGAALQILKRDSASVKFTYDKKLKKFVNILPWRKGDDKWRVRTIPQFVGVLKKSSQKFPVSDFGFVGGDLGDKKLEPLLTLLQGLRVKTLRLLPAVDSGVVSTKQKDFIHLLRHRFPNAETLEIGNFPYNWEEEKDRLTLPSLKTLICSGGVSGDVTGLEMLASASCLEAVRGFNPKYTNWFLSSNKIHAIKDYAYQMMMENCQNCPIRVYPEKLHSLATPRLKLDKLELDIKFTSQEQQAVCTALGQILESSKQSLKCLRLNIRSLFSGIVFPELSSLQELTLDVLEESWLQNLNNPSAQSFNFSNSFPNVETVSLHLEGSVGISKTFPRRDMFVGNFDSVNTLRLYGHCRILDFGFQRFPNVTKIIIAVNMFFSSYVLSAMLQHYPSLEELEFINIPMDDEDNRFSGILTGLKDKLSGLHMLTNAGRNLPPLHVLQPEVSVREFKSLKKLKLSYKPNLIRGKLSPEVNNPLSIFVLPYGFDLIPDVDVTIAYDHCSPLAREMTTALNFIPPRIHVIDEKCTESECHHHHEEPPGFPPIVLVVRIPHELIAGHRFDLV